MEFHIPGRRNFEAQALPFLEGLYRTAMHMAGSKAEAQEVVVRSFVGAYRSGHNCERCPNRRARLFNTMARIIASRDDWTTTINETTEPEQLVPDSQLMPEPPVADAVQSLLATISSEDVRSALQNLPADSRLTVLLSQQEGFSYRQIAQITETDLAIVRSRLHHGRTLMRIELLGQARRSES